MIIVMILNLIKWILNMTISKSKKKMINLVHFKKL